jgi:hypothetical protein
MTTPKQKRLREREQPGSEAFPPVLDEQFDEPRQADREFTRWRFRPYLGRRESGSEQFE